MLQPGFFDLSRRYESLDARPDPLLALNKLIPWKAFGRKLVAALEKARLRTTAETRKSAAGRKPAFQRPDKRWPRSQRRWTLVTTIGDELTKSLVA